MKLSSSVLASIVTLTLMTGTSISVLAETKDSASKVTEIRPAEVAKEVPSVASFKKIDANGDGKISLKESTIDKGLFKNFDTSDGNKDGMLTIDEYTKYAQIDAKSMVN